MKGFEMTLPSRLDHLPWGKLHTLILLALGITWLLDGLEVTLGPSIGTVLTREEPLGLSEKEVGASATAYLLEAVLGALFFGYLTDLSGRKNSFSLRATPISVFFSIGTFVGGVCAPLLFGWLLEMRSRAAVDMDYLLAAALMILAAIAEVRFGVDAERRTLEELS